MFVVVVVVVVSLSALADRRLSAGDKLAGGGGCCASCRLTWSARPSRSHSKRIAKLAAHLQSPFGDDLAALDRPGRRLKLVLISLGGPKLGPPSRHNDLSARQLPRPLPTPTPPPQPSKTNTTSGFHATQKSWLRGPRARQPSASRCRAGPSRLIIVLATV
jgi:hypothetical protein